MMQSDPEAEGLALDPRELLKMVYRRRGWLILFTLAGLLIAGAAVLLQKPVYKSTATLLIDSQQIPTALVAAPLTNIANERISKIRQRSEEHTSELQSRAHLVCRILLAQKKKKK